MLFTKEPTVILKVIEELIRAAIPLALIFGWVHWSDEQTGAVMLFVGVFVGGLTTLFVRSQTVPAEKANEQIAAALLMPPTATVSDVVKKVEKEG